MESTAFAPEPTGQPLYSEYSGHCSNLYILRLLSATPLEPEFSIR
jgi:hypothetical protein